MSQSVMEEGHTLPRLVLLITPRTWICDYASQSCPQVSRKISHSTIWLLYILVRLKVVLSTSKRRYIIFFLSIVFHSTLTRYS